MGWKPGQSGNPNGRPKGLKNKASKLAAKYEGRGGELVDKAIELAMAGDTALLKHCIDRILPPARPAEPTIQFCLPEGGTLLEKAEALLDQMAAGAIPVGAGTALINTLSRVVEVRELAERLEAIEAHLGKHT